MNFGKALEGVLRMIEFENLPRHGAIYHVC